VSLLITVWVFWRNLKQELHLEEIEVGGTIIFKRAIKFERQEFKRIGVLQDVDSWFAFEKTVMNS
jgi:hypothetical protein